MREACCPVINAVGGPSVVGGNKCARTRWHVGFTSPYCLPGCGPPPPRPVASPSSPHPPHSCSFIPPHSIHPLCSSLTSSYSLSFVPPPRLLNGSSSSMMWRAHSFWMMRWRLGVGVIRDMAYALVLGGEVAGGGRRRL